MARYKLVVVGGGSGGCSVAAKFTRKLGKGQVAVIEPAEKHYYQPMWTMVGGGMKTVEQSARPMKDVLPAQADWIRERAVAFDPKSNKVTTSSGDEVTYEYLVVAMGIQINWDAIKGLKEALDTPGVCSNYSPKYAPKTFEELKAFREGNAIFTFPNTPIKCPGAPQKILYIADQYLRKAGKRDKATLIYNTSLPVLFGVKKYAESLWKVVEDRGIVVNNRRCLTEVRPDTREAVFVDLDRPEHQFIDKYELLHVTPNMSAPDVLKACPALTDAAGYVDVDKHTLQHNRYPNVFAIGDCSSVPTSKTAAAVAAECGVLGKNLWSVMSGGQCTASYDGYTSCPLVTGYSKCILAEFKFDGVPLETFPIDQGKERWAPFVMKKELMPFLYWQLMLKGYWNGPKVIRKALHLGMSD
ncbi:sulfide:quinone oxidoreductase, mitochondrial-like isoform X2 [Amphibalanus amphitrite]|uniref:sulfide:quinone oxidoreductase, mitochondrial-like isoform X2 n=1 Tax=Amphibalanus amphitrite TaxID=1232801 RepID=UPI001C91D141|nr:sulfide:quinone oxidoreductase, mitochondrial-like isoform X2 [Amphibalanus amphitrite]